MALSYKHGLLFGLPFLALCAMVFTTLYEDTKTMTFVHPNSALHLNVGKRRAQDVPDIALGPGHKYIKYIGRFKKNPDNAEEVWFDFPGSVIRLKFGSVETLGVFLQEKSAGMYRIELNNVEVGTLITDADDGEYYEILQNLNPKLRYNVEIYKASEPARSSGMNVEENFVTFKGFAASGGKIRTYSQGVPKNRMLFIGDSQSFGAGTLVGLSGASGCSTDKARFLSSSNYYSWTAMMCREFDAHCNHVSWGGRGLIINGDATRTDTIPQIWQRTVGTIADADWDHGRFKPQAIFVQLGQNDFRPTNEGLFKTTEWRDAYVDFVQDLKNKAGSKATPTWIVCGSMSNAPKYCDVIDEIIEILKSGGYSKTYKLNNLIDSPLKGCNNHPNWANNEEIVGNIEAEVRGILGWSDPSPSSSPSPRPPGVSASRTPSNTPTRSPSKSRSSSRSRSASRTMTRTMTRTPTRTGTRTASPIPDPSPSPSPSVGSGGGGGSGGEPSPVPSVATSSGASSSPAPASPSNTPSVSPAICSCSTREACGPEHADFVALCDSVSAGCTCADRSGCSEEDAEFEALCDGLAAGNQNPSASSPSSESFGHWPLVVGIAGLGVAYAVGTVVYLRVKRRRRRLMFLERKLKEGKQLSARGLEELEHGASAIRLDSGDEFSPRSGASPRAITAGSSAVAPRTSPGRSPSTPSSVAHRQGKNRHRDSGSRSPRSSKEHKKRGQRSSSRRDLLSSQRSQDASGFAESIDIDVADDDFGASSSPRGSPKSSPRSSRRDRRPGGHRHSDRNRRASSKSRSKSPRRSKGLDKDEERHHHRSKSPLSAREDEKEEHDDGESRSPRHHHRRSSSKGRNDEQGRSRSSRHTGDRDSDKRSSTGSGDKNKDRGRDGRDSDRKHSGRGRSEHREKGSKGDGSRDRDHRRSKSSSRSPRKADKSPRHASDDPPKKSRSSRSLMSRKESNPMDLWRDQKRKERDDRHKSRGRVAKTSTPRKSHKSDASFV